MYKQLVLLLILVLTFISCSGQKKKYTFNIDKQKIFINSNDNNSTALIEAEITLEYKGKALMKELNNLSVLIEKRIVDVLGDIPFAEIPLEQEEKENLKSEILRAVNSLLSGKNGKVEKVYYTYFFSAVQ